jgi:hypothetical protein
MKWTWRILMVASLLFAACDKGGEQEAQVTEGEQAEEATESTEAEEATEPTEEAEEEAAEPFEGIRNGYFESERLNVRFRIPGDWQRTSTGGDDSLTFEGPAGIQMVVANSQSIQLIDANFAQLNDRVSFDSVNVLPDRTEAAPLNGLPGYRVEGDALLRGENLPIYFISQAVSVPGEPIMATIFIPGDNYFENSDTMKAVLDSIEALDLRPE